MRKFSIAGILALSLAAVTTTVATEYDFLSWSFTAPHLNDPDGDVPNPPNGAIAYDSTDDELQGVVNGTWVDLGATAQVKNSSGPIAVEAARVTCSASPSVDNEVGDWIDNSTPIAQNGTGDCHVNLITGKFTAAPVCTCTIYSSGTAHADRNCEIYSTSTSQVRFVQGTGVGANNFQMMLICVGATN